MKAIEFVDAAIHWAKAEGLKALGYQGYCNYVRDNRKDYPNLYSYLVETAYLLPLKKAVTVAPLEDSQQCA